MIIYYYKVITVVQKIVCKLI